MGRTQHFCYVLLRNNLPQDLMASNHHRFIIFHTLTGQEGGLGSAGEFFCFTWHDGSHIFNWQLFLSGVQHGFPNVFGPLVVMVERLCSAGLLISVTTCGFSPVMVPG